jgi:hypothetical protein
VSLSDDLHDVVDIEVDRIGSGCRKTTTGPSGDYPGAGTEEILSAHLRERQLKSWIIDLDRR